MIPRLFLLPVLLFIPAVYGSALTVAISANEQQCYYADVDKPKEKIGFYFAVQSGGNFEIGFSVKGPNDKMILEMSEERQGDFVFTANEVGEYSFCFSNELSGLSSKLIDFDITVESEPRREASAKPGQLEEQTSEIEESISRLSGLLNNIRRTQRYFHTRENRGFSLVKNTQSRIFWYTLLESAGVMAMAIVQIVVIQNFFTKTGRRYKV